MRVKACVLALALSSIQTAAAAQVAATPARTIQLSKVVLDPDISKTDQKVKVGTVCLFAGQPLNFGSERTMNFEKFERLFNTAMQKGGLNVLAKSTNMFESEDNGAHPDFLIGATLRPRSVDICDSINGQKGTVVLAVEWQIYDRGKQQVVEAETTEGSGQLLKFQRSGLSAMFDLAFSDAVTALIGQHALNKLVGAPAS